MITFRTVEEKDFIRLHTWLETKHVKEFWYPEKTFSYNDVYEKYYKRITSSDVKMFIIVLNNKDIGYIQSYVEDNLELYEISEKAMGLDLYIGEQSFLNKGFGTEIIREFIEKHIFSNSQIKYAVIDPNITNKRAIRSYQKAGFSFVKQAYCEKQKQMTYYMKLEKKEKL